MRDLVIMFGIAALAPMILRRPYIGVLAWTWIAILNPHREAFGFSVTLRVNLLVVLITLVAFLLSTERKQWPGGRTALVFMLFVAWTTLACALSPDPATAFGWWFDFVIKMALHMVLVMILITSRHRLIALVWTFALSLGYHAVKIALVTIANGGVIARLTGFGPHGTMIDDRNHFALAMALLAPVLFFLWKHASMRIMRVGCLVGLGCSVLAVVGSQSRGGFVTMGIVLVYMWWKTSYKWLSGGVVVALAMGAFSALPPEIKERLYTITEQVEEREAFEDQAELDQSFCLRLAAWQVGWDMARDSPVWGHGLRSIQNVDVATAYLSPDHVCSDNPKYGVRAAHNIYVEVMTDSGFVGLALFVGILGSAWITCLSIMRRARARPELLWARDLASMLQVALVAYAAGGALLSLAYYDGYYILIAMIVVLDRLVREAEGAARPRRVVPPRRASARRPGRAPRGSPA